jgi:4-hydroxy-3-polyprenylbenzoate decarboxylase
LSRAFAKYRPVRIIVGITGASGAIYAQRLLDCLDASHEVHVILSQYASAVINEELPKGLIVREGIPMHGARSMNVPFASGSNAFDAMVIVPCSMGTLGRIAHGLSSDVILRAADVMLKERRKLILVPRETPFNLIHIRNMELLLLAGATLLPANPQFYTGAQSALELADTVVSRILDQLGIANTLSPRWREELE